MASTKRTVCGSVRFGMTAGKCWSVPRPYVLWIKCHFTRICLPSYHTGEICDQSQAISPCETCWHHLEITRQLWVLPGTGLFQGRRRGAHFNIFPLLTEHFLSNCNYVRLSYREWNPGSSKHCAFPVFQLGRCVSSMCFSKHTYTCFCDKHKCYVTPERQSSVQEDSETRLLNNSVEFGLWKLLKMDWSSDEKVWISTWSCLKYNSGRCR
jgi:hypothetical protein